MTTPILSIHASQQIATRHISTQEEVLQAVSRHASHILRLAGRTDEVKVIVRTYQTRIVLNDGSNGDVVLACVDCRTLVIKTVMLQRSSQVARKRQYEAYL